MVGEPGQGDGRIQAAIKQAEDIKKKSIVITADEPVLINQLVDLPVAKPAVATYEVSRLEMISVNSTEGILMLQNQAVIKAQINTILKTESPISKELLCKRVLEAWGITLALERGVAAWDGERIIYAG